MSQRKVSQFSAFEFRPDFTAREPDLAAPPAPAAPDEETVAIPVMELAALGAQLQAEAIASVRAPADAALVEKLEAAAEKLGAALAQLTELATALDLAARMGQVPPALAPVAEKAAQSLCDGQGDLFAACQSLTHKN